MSKPKFQDAFGRAPESFNRFVENTLAARMEEEQMKLKHKSIGGVWVLAIVLLLLMGTALALTGGFGVLEFRSVNDPALTDKVVDLSEIPAVETAIARYQVTDALLDNNNLMLTITAEALDPETYMMVNGDDRTAAMGLDKTFGQLAKEAGKKMLHSMPTKLLVNGALPPQTMFDYRFEDGKIHWLLEVRGLDIPGGELKIDCEFTDFILNGTTVVQESDEMQSIKYHKSAENKAILSFAMQVESIKGETIRFAGPIETECATVDWVEITRSSLGTYSRIQFTVHSDMTEEEAKLLRSVSFSFAYDAKGKDRLQGSGGSTARVDGKMEYDDLRGIAQLAQMTWAPLDASPETLYLMPMTVTGPAEGVQPVTIEIIPLPLSEAEKVE